MVEQNTTPICVTLPTDDEIVAFLRERPGRTLAEICCHFTIPLQVNVKGHDYTPEAKAIRNQLQRLRKARKIRNEQGARWVLW